MNSDSAFTRNIFRGIADRPRQVNQKNKLYRTKLILSETKPENTIIRTVLILKYYG